MMGPSPAAGAEYYLSGNGATDACWLGTGAEKLGISGDVTVEKAEMLFSGFHPDGTPLVQNAGDVHRQRGWDLTCVPMKDYSIWLAAAPDEAERDFRKKPLVEATREILAEIEREAAITRRGHGGSVRESVGLVGFAAFHFGNRNLEPFAHAHLVIKNLGFRADGSTGSIASQPFYDRQKEFGARFDELLAEKLKAIGVRVEQTEKGYVMPDVPRSLVDALSSRRKEIEAELARKGVAGPKAAEIAAKATRKKKEQNPTLAELHEKWKEVFEAHGYRPERLVGRATPSEAHEQEEAKARDARDPRGKAPTEDTKASQHNPKVLSAAIRDAVREVAERENHFGEDDVMRALNTPRRARNLAEGRLEEKAIRQAVRDELARPREYVRLKEDRFTTREQLKTEEKLLRDARKLNGRKPQGVKEKLIDRAAKKYVALSAEDKNALRHVTSPKGGSIRFVEAQAGTDKRGFLLAANEVWQQTGYRVIACAPSSSSAEAFRRETRIDTSTVQGLLKSVEGPSLAQNLGHHLRQIVRAAAKKPTWTLKPYIDRKTVVVVDGANTLGTRDMAKLVRAAARGGGQLVFIGDRHELQAFHHGGAFAHLADTYGKAELRENRTQERARGKENVSSVREGNAAEFLRNLQKGKRLVVGADREETVETLVADWSRQKPVDQKRSLILTVSNDDAKDVNRRCQASRRASGQISEKSVTNGVERFHAGDRVLFTRGSKVHGVAGGEPGTVTSVIERLNIMTAKLAGGRSVTVPLRTFEHVKLAYAVTVHQAQAANAEQVFVLAGGHAQDRGLSTVQASRHRDTLRVYAPEWVVGKDLHILKAQMERSREQTLAHKLMDAERQRKRDERAQERSHSREETHA